MTFEVMETIKNFLFNVIVIIGLTAIILLILWGILELLNRFFKFSKYIIMYHEYKRNDQLYDLRSKLIVSKDGDISYSCIGDLEEQIQILNKAIENRNNLIKLQEKYSK